MKKSVSLVSGLAFALALGTLAGSARARTAEEILASGSASEKGRAVVAELAARNTGWKDLSGNVEMVLRDASGSEAKRSFTVKILEKPSATAGDYSLVVFDAPADVKGTAVLSHAQADSDDEQWLFLPSARRVKRVAAANRTGSFAGSEFSFEDLTAAEQKKYEWQLLGVHACGSLQCFSVEAKPKDASSGYSRRVLEIDTTELRIQSVDFFDRKGARLKTLAYGDYAKLENRFWRARSWTMTNHQSGKSTVIRFASMKLGNGYSANDFAPAKLEK
jgi:outer membrane lipoprotein-sorting protein